MKTSIESIAKKIAGVLLILSSIYALYTSGFGLQSALTQRTIHWTFMISCIFLLYPWKKGRKISMFNLILAAVAAAATLYVTFTWEQNALRIEDPSTFETVLSIIGIILVLEATRRSMGAAMPIIAIIALIYSFVGPYLPGMLKHKGFTLTSLASFVYTTSEGIFGMAMGTSATYIIVFVLFGSFLARSGAGQLFVDMSLSAVGKYRSGPASATILSNALMGIISGSPVANVVTTGSFAIPLLDKSRYPKLKGAAILAVAATGSMFTPPVMGAGAFLIADYLGIAYGKVVAAAVFPALLFYLSLFVNADIGAVKGGLKGLTKEELPNLKKALVERGLLLIPIILLIGLIVYGWSALKSAFWCTVLIVVLAAVKKSTRMSLARIKESMVAGSKDALSIAAACASAGIIVGVVSITGLGVKFSSLLIQLGAGNVFLSLFLTMIAALIMGMGLPPTAVYIVLAALTVPALQHLGIAPMAAHFFVFYFSCIGAITPPVALAAYSSAALAHTDPFKTGWVAFRMGAVAYVVPYIFAYQPILLLQGGSGAFQTIQALVTATIGVIFLTYGLEGFRKDHLNAVIRILYVAGALGLMIPGWVTDLIGIVLIIIGLLLENKIKVKNPPVNTEEVPAAATEGKV